MDNKGLEEHKFENSDHNVKWSFVELPSWDQTQRELLIFNGGKYERVAKTERRLKEFDAKSVKKIWYVICFLHVDIPVVRISHACVLKKKVLFGR